MTTRSELQITCRESSRKPQKYEVEFLAQNSMMSSACAVPPRPYTPSLQPHVAAGVWRVVSGMQVCVPIWPGAGARVTPDPIVSRGCIIHTSRRTISWWGGGAAYSRWPDSRDFSFTVTGAPSQRLAFSCLPQVCQECYSLPLSPPPLDLSPS
jgi:hypothetical protein